MVESSYQMSRVLCMLSEAKMQGIDRCDKLEEIVSECERILSRDPHNADAIADKSEAQMLLGLFC